MARDLALVIEIDDKNWTDEVDALFERNLPFATSMAINRTVYRTQQVLRNQMDRYYQGGAIPFTKRSILYSKSHKRSLSAMVYVNPDGDREYIMDTMTGSTVRPGRGKATRVQPVRLRLTKQGNISTRYEAGSGGKIAKLLSNKRKYFSGRPKGRPNSEDFAGVWERMGRGGKDNLRMIAHFKKSWRQKHIFPGFTIARMEIERAFGDEFQVAISKATKGRVG